MKRLMFILCLLAGLVLPAPAQEAAAPVPEAPKGGLVKKLLKAGGRAATDYLDRKLDAKAARDEPAATPAAEGTPQKRTWRERGGDMFQSFLAKSAEEMGEEPLARWLAHALKQALDVLLEDYKAQYKEEGRAYAKELGEKMVERVREDPKISASITSVQVLCWCVIAYLTLVTLIMLTCLLCLKRANGRLLAAIEELRSRPAAK